MNGKSGSDMEVVGGCIHLQQIAHQFKTKICLCQGKQDVTLRGTDDE